MYNIKWFSFYSLCYWMISFFFFSLFGHCFDVNNVPKIKLDNKKAVKYRAGAGTQKKTFCSWFQFLSPFHFDVAHVVVNIVGIDEFYLVSVIRAQDRKWIFDADIQFPYWRQNEINKHCVLPLAIFAISLLVHLHINSALDSHFPFNLNNFLSLLVFVSFQTSSSSSTLTRIMQCIKTEFKDRMLFRWHFFFSRCWLLSYQ